MDEQTATQIRYRQQRVVIQRRCGTYRYDAAVVTHRRWEGVHVVGRRGASPQQMGNHNETDLLLGKFVIREISRQLVTEMRDCSVVGSNDRIDNTAECV